VNEIVSGIPTDEEIAAIAAALLLRHPARSSPQSGERRRRAGASTWGLAMHYPDLEFDELRDLAQTGRVL
jgi:hypothetical protein